MEARRPWNGVRETAPYLERAAKLMTEEEQAFVVESLARDPEQGKVIRSSGGVRKARFAVGQRGKSGGVRVIYYFYNETMPLYLFTVFAKNERADLSKNELAAMAKVAQAIREQHQKKGR